MLLSAHIEIAYKKLCENRRYHPANSDIWDFRYHWDKSLATIINKIEHNRYTFSPLRVITKADGSHVALWSSADAFVINLLTLYLTPLLPVHIKCEHIKGHGGGKASIVKLDGTIIQPNGYRYVCRTDIKGYYANINPARLLAQLRCYVSDPTVLNLLSQFLHYSVEHGGLFHTPRKGLARSSSLSPLLAAFHLYEVDAHFARSAQCYYIRYMDDFIILTRTRWHLKRAVKQLNCFFSAFGFIQHPDKTFIGHIAKGFDWMGFWFTGQGCQCVAPRARQNHQMKLNRLLEHVRKLPAKQRAIRTMSYLYRWRLWQESVFTALTSGSRSPAHWPTKCLGWSPGGTRV